MNNMLLKRYQSFYQYLNLSNINLDFTPRKIIFIIMGLKRESIINKISIYLFQTASCFKHEVINNYFVFEFLIIYSVKVTFC